MKTPPVILIVLVVILLAAAFFVGKRFLSPPKTSAFGKYQGFSEKIYDGIQSEPCNCEICLAYCARPGWWTVEQATKAMEAGYASRMMLEISPELDFGVLSPAFKGCESQLANYSLITRGCTFMQNNLCELYGSGIQPLERRFCRHLRGGLGPQCHAALEAGWKSCQGRGLVEKWLLLHPV